jgi:hypothetical protein
MNSAYLTTLACAALLFGGVVANAQDPAAQAANSSSTPGKSTNGNDLNTNTPAPRVDPMNSPTTAGQNKSTGNDLVDQNGPPNSNGSASKGNMKQASASRPDFSTLDKTGKGSLTAADIKGNRWLRKNFARCDTDHDGTLDRSEYDACK